jgi:hypothetical protein
MLSKISIHAFYNTIKFISFLSLIYLSTGCTTNKLSVYIDYLSHENLASYHVNTPDPVLNDPPIGQRLIISWTVPKKYLNYQDLQVQYKIRLRNGEEVSDSIFIKKPSGDYIFSIINNEYFRTGGIQTYKVQIVADREVLDEWLHQLWTELIIFEKQEEKDNEE